MLGKARGLKRSEAWGFSPLTTKEERTTRLDQVQRWRSYSKIFPSRVMVREFHI